MLVLAGLVVDGGRAVNARSTAADVAEQAARAGVMQLDPATIGGGTVRVDVNAAKIAAEAFLRARGYDQFTVAASPTDVQVTVQTTVRTALLSLIMIPTMEVSGSATSRPAEGIVTEIQGP
jgi:Flp pilus assembly protein TadG